MKSKDELLSLAGKLANAARRVTGGGKSPFMNGGRGASVMDHQAFDDLLKAVNEYDDAIFSNVIEKSSPPPTSPTR